MERRRLDALARSAHEPSVRLAARRCALAALPGACLAAVDVDRGEDGADLVERAFRRDPERGAAALAPWSCRHIRFDAAFEAASASPYPPSPLRARHPTWLAAREPQEAAFGGLAGGACSHCGGPLHRLLAAPAGALSAGAPPLTLSACLSCLIWDHIPLFYAHDPDGAAACISGGDGRTQPRFPAPPLRRSAASLHALGRRWDVQDWNGRIENLNRLGGAPTWVQNPEFPDCPSCGEIMPFLAQFDSDLPDEEGGRFLWGSGGLGHVFHCPPCRTTAVSAQWT